MTDDTQQDERLELARLVQAEAEGEPLEGQIAVARVVLLRWSHWRRFEAAGPTLHDTIMARDQFESVSNGRFSGITEPNDAAHVAADLAFRGVDPAPGAEFFYNPIIVRQRGGNWVAKNTVPLKVIGRHVFARSKP